MGMGMDSDPSLSLVFSASKGCTLSIFLPTLTTTPISDVFNQHTRNTSPVALPIPLCLYRFTFSVVPFASFGRQAHRCANKAVQSAFPSARRLSP